MTAVSVEAHEDAVATTTAAPHPPAPRTAAEAGLGEGLLSQLVLKQISS